MANPEHVAILEQGIEVWNAWRSENAELKPDLSAAHLSGRDLKSIDFRITDLQKADLSNAKLSKALFAGANMQHANLDEAIAEEANFWRVKAQGASLKATSLMGSSLTETDLSGADLSNALLNGTRIRWARFTDTNLQDSQFVGATIFVSHFSGANFSNATFGGTIFAGVEIYSAKGLEKATHRARSFIDSNTLFNPKGRIPEVFLRGCGVPDDMIDYIRSIAGAIQFYSCFISYSRQDEEFTKRIHADLQDRGVRCWYAPEDLRIGDKFRDNIEQSIRGHDKLLIVLSEHSLASDWVEREVLAAMDKEKDTGQLVLFPIRLDDAVMESTASWAADIRRARHIGNFTNWKQHDSYQKAFERLLRDLKAAD